MSSAFVFARVRFARSVRLSERMRRVWSHSFLETIASCSPG
ncbi:MAG: hypothetical protein RL885_07825 [Planctomycetota bacterium]